MGLLLATLALAACAPATVGPSDGDPGTLTLERGDAQQLDFAPGALAAYDIQLTVSGSALRVNAPQWCKVGGAAIACLVPVVPAGRHFLLPLTGIDVGAVVRYKRQPGGVELVRRAP